MSGLSPESVASASTLSDLGRLLRELRRRDARLRHARQATYRELADKTGWSHAIIGEYLTGNTLPPTDRFDALVRLLGATPAELRQLATARDRVEESQRAPSGRIALEEVRLGGPAMVGRRYELAGLGSAVQAVARGAGEVVFLVGEAGIGKTRLATETTRFATDAGLRVMRGRSAKPAVQFRPLSEALLSVVRKSGLPDDPDLLPYRPVLSRLIPQWRLEHPAGGDDSLVVLAEAVLRLAVALGRQGCLVVLEDLQDADPETLAVMDYLADNVAGEPVLLLGTVRPEPSAGLEFVRAAQRRRAATVFELNRLDDDGVRQLAGSCLDVAADQVPEPVMERLLATADGVPLHVEELLAGMVGDGLLVRASGRWEVAGPLANMVPISLAATLTGRADRLTPKARAVLEAAALLGRRGPIVTAGAAVGVQGEELTHCLREAVEAQLLVPDGDSFAFRHALVAEAVRARMLPTERVSLSRRLASSLSDMDDQLAGELWYASGEYGRAAELFGMAGRRAAAQGALSTATSLLERALSIADGHPADVVETLVDVYAMAGRVADAYELGAKMAGHPEAHLRLARVAVAAGHWERGLQELETVRDLLGEAMDVASAARVDAIGARLVFGHPTPERVSMARALAQRALQAAQASSQPEVACDALDTLGRCARLRDLVEADALYRQGLSIADAHQLVHHKVRLLYNIGADDGIRDADPRRLVAALALANQVGAVETALDIELELAVVRTCRGEYTAAEQSAMRCEETAERLRLTHTRIIAVAVRIFAAAHQGRRSVLDALLARYRELGGEEDDLTTAVRGFGQAVCLLLEERPDQAREQLCRAVADESTRPASYLSLVHGPHLLLSVLAGAAGEKEYQLMAGSAQGQAGWNRQFMVLAQAVLHGQAGRAAQAAQAMSEFAQVSVRYPMAHHLGLRLAAQAGLAQGWGEPVSWLRKAEIYFHTSVPPVAGACRELLRGAGVKVHQHRVGSEAIPKAFRELGISVREYEVLQLVAERLSNQQIGQRMFLSPRTVEKHVARLLAKTHQPNRASLATFVADHGPR